MKILPALVALLVSFPASAQELGRLFLTPEQRAALDARRKARVPDKPAAPVVASPVTRVDGYVRRSQGPSTAWVNGEPVTAGTGDEARIVERAGEGRVAVPVGEGGSRMALKPGQTVERQTGEVRDVLGDGEIRVRQWPSPR